MFREVIFRGKKNKIKVTKVFLMVGLIAGYLLCIILLNKSFCFYVFFV